MFWEFRKREEVSGTCKLYVKDSKSCIVNLCYSSFTGAFKELRANSLPSSYFPMNLLVRAGKILFKRRVEPSQKVKQASIPDAGYEEHHKFPKWHWGKVSKKCRSRMFPCSICCEKKLLVMLVNILLFILLVLLFKCKYHEQVDDITQYSCDFFCFHITYFILIPHSSLLLFYFPSSWVKAFQIY